MSDLFDVVADHLHRISRPRPDGLRITLDTELYRDLRLYGDDLWELALWMQRTFDVEGTFIPTQYGPAEWPLLWLFTRLKKLLRLNDTQHESLTVRDILSVIEAKRWLPLRR